MADSNTDRVATTPGLVGQGSFASTLGAAATAGIAGPALTCAAGSLAFVAVALSPYSIEPRMVTNEGNLCCAGDLSALNMFFLKAILTISHYLYLIMVWGAIAGAISSVLVLNATFALFPRAAWKAVLHSYFAVYFIYSAVILQAGFIVSAGVYNDGTFAAYASVAFLVACGTIGVWPVWDQFGGFVKSARFLAPPKDLPYENVREESVHRAGQLRAAPLEIQSAIDPRYKRAIALNGALSLLFLLSPFLGHSYLGANVLAFAILVLWPAAKFALITASLFRAIPNRGVQMVIDRRGITDKNETTAWTEIGRVWTETGTARNLLILEISPAAYRRARRFWSLPDRLLGFGYAKLKARHIGTFTTVLDADLLNATAQEIQNGIEARRLPRTQWMPTVTGSTEIPQGQR